MPDLIAIIVPCYNAAQYLSACLESLLAQTYPHVQIYAVDDASQDNTADILRQYAAKDSRITPLFQTKNGGVSAARNRALQELKEEFCMFVDGDDTLPPNAVEILIAIKNKNQVEFPCANCLEVSQDGQPIRRHYRQHGTRFLDMGSGLAAFFKYQEVFCTSTFKLFPVKSLREHHILFNTSLCYAEDTLFTHQYLLACRPICWIDFDSTVYLYRQLDASCIHAIPLDRRLADLETLLRALFQLARQYGCSNQIALKKSTEYIWAIKKFSQNHQERCDRIQQMLQSELFLQYMMPTLARYGNLKQKLCIWLLQKGCLQAIRFW